MGVHDALDEVVALHPVLVGGAVGEVREGRFAEFVIFESPEILEVLPDLESYRPVVVVSFDRVLQRLSLRMALNADVVGADGIQPCRIHDIGREGSPTCALRVRGTSHSPRSIPLPPWSGRCSSRNGSRRTAGRWDAACYRPDSAAPTSRCRRNHVGAPDVVRDVPLRGEWKVIVAIFLEVALLPLAAVDEGDVPS